MAHLHENGVTEETCEEESCCRLREAGMLSYTDVVACQTCQATFQVRTLLDEMLVDLNGPEGRDAMISESRERTMKAARERGCRGCNPSV